MSHTSSRAALRLLTTVLLAASIANAVALPVPNASTDQLPSTSDVEAALAIAATPEDNFFDDVEEGLRSRTGLQILRDFFARLFRWDEPDSSDTGATVTVTVSVVLSSSIATPPGPPSSISTVDVSSEVAPTPEITPTSSSNHDIFSILPVGPMTTAINLTLPDPIFSAASSPVPILPPYPANSSLSLTGPPATAVIITGYFSTNPIETGIPIYNTRTNSTSTVTSEPTSIILVTATIGTGLPLPSDVSAPLWTNSTSVPTPLSTSAVPLGTDVPLYPNTTLVVPIIVNATGSAGTVLNVTLPIALPTSTSATSGTGLDYGYGYGSFTQIPPYANATYAAPTGIVGTGTAAAVSTSTSTSTTTTTVLEVPTDVTFPAPVVVTLNESALDSVYPGQS